MKLAIRVAIASIALAALGGCVYDPGYGYVRGDGYYGDAYYGTAPAYYDYGPGYGYGYGYPGYYGPSFSLGLNYGGYYRHRGGYGHGHWQGGHDGHHDWRGHSSGHGRTSHGDTSRSHHRSSN
jgi:hypothetical protein